MEYVGDNKQIYDKLLEKNYSIHKIVFTNYYNNTMLKLLY